MLLVETKMLLVKTKMLLVKTKMLLVKTSLAPKSPVFASSSFVFLKLVLARRQWLFRCPIPFNALGCFGAQYPLTQRVARERPHSRQDSKLARANLHNVELITQLQVSPINTPRQSAAGPSQHYWCTPMFDITLDLTLKTRHVQKDSFCSWRKGSCSKIAKTKKVEGSFSVAIKPSSVLARIEFFLCFLNPFMAWNYRRFEDLEKCFKSCFGLGAFLAIAILFGLDPSRIAIAVCFKSQDTALSGKWPGVSFLKLMWLW